MIGRLVLGVLGVWLLRNVLSLTRNVRAARAAGLPTIVSPVSITNPLWLAFQPLLTPLLLKLPYGIGQFSRFAKRGWQYAERYQVHQEIGKVFALVTPSSIIVYISDAAVSDEVFERKRDFLKPVHLTKPLEIFGPAVLTVDGPDWQRHRKITANTFNARNHRLVWAESLVQAQQMLESWMEKGAAGVNSVARDTNTLALHVITGAGFGKTYHFLEGSKTKDLLSGQLTYRHCLETVLKEFVLIFVVPSWIYTLPLLPQRLRDYQRARDQLQRYMADMVTAAKSKLQGNQPEEGNLLSALVRENEHLGPEDQDEKIRGFRGLTDAEMYGNFFIYSFAGHETTSHTLAYAIYFLAAFPEWQDWVQEELDHVLHNQQSVDTLNVDAAAPQLKRCLALMLETLRLFPALSNILKRSRATPVDLMHGDKAITIPANSLVAPNLIALHSHPDYWGSDPLEWKPLRWIKTPSSNEAQSNAPLSSEEVRTPIRGAYIPWGDGPRVCPGRKFSQVEFVAVIVTILWRARLEVVPLAGEDASSARRRTKQVIDASGPVLTLFMKAPESVNIRVVERHGDDKTPP